MIGIIAASAQNDILRDGNTVGWYDASNLDYITKDGSNLVSVISDVLGSGRNLNLASGATTAQWSSNKITFNGSSNSFQTGAITLVQPEFIYIVFKPLAWANFCKVIDGNGANKMILGMYTSTPSFAAAAGSLSSLISITMNTTVIVRILFNGANSKFILNNETPVTGNFGATNGGGITLGSEGTGAVRFANFEFSELIVRKVSDSATNETAIYNYLKTKWGL